MRPHNSARPRNAFQESYVIRRKLKSGIVVSKHSRIDCCCCCKISHLSPNYYGWYSFILCCTSCIYYAYIRAVFYYWVGYNSSSSSRFIQYCRIPSVLFRKPVDHCNLWPVDCSPLSEAVNRRRLVRFNRIRLSRSPPTNLQPGRGHSISLKTISFFFYGGRGG